jgi:plasmid stabilization system protein ParE
MNAIQFHPEAEAEMIDAAVWYENQQKNLGGRFLATVQDGLNRIKINPLLFAIAEGRARQCILHTFPFSIIFEIHETTLIVLAVMHHRRDPDSWQHRK